MQVLVPLLAVAGVFLIVGLIVTAVKWLSIIALIVVVFALARFYRERRR